MTSPLFFKHHVFFCINQRDDGRASCGDCGALPVQKYAKQRIKELHLNGPGNVRINQAGCLDRCDLGPVLVVYPEGVWYTYVDNHDIDEIIDSHLTHGKIVERLLLPNT
jgi:(2Fe-2S) ferredoxin